MPPRQRRRRRKLRLVIDTNVVVRGIRAFRQQPPDPTTPELRLLAGWVEDGNLFEWLFSDAILDEYREVLRRLRVPPATVGRVVNLLRQGGTLVETNDGGSFSPDTDDDVFYYCALDGDGDLIVTDNTRDFPPLEARKRPRIVKPIDALKHIFKER